MARVVKRPDRNKRDWWIDFKDAQGLRHWKKVGPSKKVAQEVLNDILNKIAKEEYLGVVESSRITFADYAKDWLAGLRPDLKPKTRERWENILEKHLKPYFKCSLRAINAAMVEAYVRQRVAAGRAGATVNSEMTVLKNMLRRAVARRLLGRNPLRDGQGQLLDGLRPLKVPKGRLRYLTLDEIDRLLALCAAVPCLKAFAQVALNSGMRRNEILSLTYQMLDRENRLVRLTETKNGEARIVHLNATAMQALESLPRRLDGKLFPFGPNQVSVAFKRAVRRAEIEDFRLHDCRHTFASYQAMGGMQQRGLQDLLGHRDGRMTERYTHLSDEFLRAAVDRVNLGSGDRKKREQPATSPATAAEAQAAP